MGPERFHCERKNVEANQKVHSRTFTMASINIVNSKRIELLTKINYDTWRIQAEALLVKSDSWPYVSGDIPKPAVAARAKHSPRPRPHGTLGSSAIERRNQTSF